MIPVAATLFFRSPLPGSIYVDSLIANLTRGLASVALPTHGAPQSLANKRCDASSLIFTFAASYSPRRTVTKCIRYLPSNTQDNALPDLLLSTAKGQSLVKTPVDSDASMGRPRRDLSHATVSSLNCFQRKIGSQVNLRVCVILQ